MEEKCFREKVTTPEGVIASAEGDSLILKGPKGELKKELRDVFVKLSVEDGAVVIHSGKSTKRQKRMLGTFKSHIKNMVKGVTEGFTYKLRICSGHFPMNVNFNKGEFTVKNFIGEKVPRVMRVKEGVNIKIEGTDITVEALDKEVAGQTAASIEQLTKRPGFDSRIFQAGIYIIEKAGKEIKGQ